MIADLNVLQVFQSETAITPAAAEVKTTKMKRAGIKVKQFSVWLSPKNWFSRFSSIDIDMSEFACKKTLPKE
jgi:hypothetical protein